MITIERRVGRLVEIRETGEVALDFAKFGRVIALANEVGPDAQVVMCVDMRGANPLKREEQEKRVTLMKSQSQRIARCAALYRDDPARRMATANMSRSAGAEKFSPAFSPEEAVALLSPLLNAAEIGRLKIFVGAQSLKTD